MKRIMLSGAIFVLLLLIVPAWQENARAQASASAWTAPYRLYQSAAQVSNPLVVADAYDTVHVFWVEGPVEQTPSASPSVIFHMQNINGRWSKPSDILLSPGNGSATSPEVAADLFGRLHIIWHGPNNALYYSKVDARKAAEAGAWSAPKAVSTSLSHTGIFADLQGRVHVVYPSTSGFGVFYTLSLDGGSSWSSPATVALPSRDNSAADYTQVAVDSVGTIHVVWTEFQLPNAWPPLGVFYSRSSDGGKTWSGALRLAGEGYDQATTRVDTENIVHVDWNGMVGVGGRYYVQSRDSGKTWSKPVAAIPPRIGGTSGYTDLALDSNNTLHMASSVGEFGGIKYLALQNGVWSAPLGISGDLKGTRVESVEQPRIAVSGGNRLNVVFEVGFEAIYYASRVTDAPAVHSTAAPPEPVAPSRPPATATAKPSASATLQPATPRPSLATEDPGVQPGSDASLALLLATVPVALLVGVVMLAKLKGL